MPNKWQGFGPQKDAQAHCKMRNVCKHTHFITLVCIMNEIHTAVHKNSVVVWICCTHTNANTAMIEVVINSWAAKIR